MADANCFERDRYAAVDVAAAVPQAALRLRGVLWSIATPWLQLHAGFTAPQWLGLPLRHFVAPHPICCANRGGHHW